MDASWVVKYQRVGLCSYACPESLLSAVCLNITETGEWLGGYKDH